MQNSALQPLPPVILSDEQGEKVDIIKNDEVTQELQQQQVFSQEEVKMREDEELMIKKPLINKSCESGDRNSDSGSKGDAPVGDSLNNDYYDSSGSSSSEEHHEHSHTCNHNHKNDEHKHDSDCDSDNQITTYEHVQDEAQHVHSHSCKHDRSPQIEKITPQKESEVFIDKFDKPIVFKKTEEVKHILEEVYGDKVEIGVVDSSVEQQQRLKACLKNCFHCNETNENLDSKFKDLTAIITEIKICGRTIFDQNFFNKVIVLAQIDNPKKSMKVMSLFEQLFNDKYVLQYMLDLTDHARLIVDIINSYLVLMDKFKTTSLEIEAKVSFSIFKSLLVELGFSDKFNLLAFNQTIMHRTDSILLNHEQKELLEMAKHFAKFKELGSKQESIKYIILLLGKCDNVIEQYKIMVYYLSPIFLELGNAHYESYEQKVIHINQILDLIDRYIFPIEFLINIETTRVQGTRTYYLKSLKQIVQNFPKIFTLVGGFLNQVLLMPSDIQLNLRSLFIIRRMYYFFFDDLQIRQLIEGPIVTVLSNISVYARDVVQVKEPTLFLHKLMEDKNTLASLLEKLAHNEHIQKLKENKYFSVKAKSYPFDIDIQYNFNTLNFQVNYPLFKNIEPGCIFFHNILVSKPETIIYWSFKTINYDIKFGLFKMDTLSSELQIDAYEEEKQIKAIIKLQKADSHKEPVMAYSLVSLPGFYRIVFDNTYSYWRSKELLYTIQVLEP